MTVSELIDKLKDCAPSDEVEVYVDSENYQFPATGMEAYEGKVVLF